MRKILFFVLLNYFAFGQDKRIDSLKNELKSKTDTESKVDLYEKIITLYWTESIDSAFSYTNRLKKLSLEKKHLNGIIISEIYTAVNYEAIDKMDISDSIFKKIINKIPSDEFKLKGIYYYNYGNHLFYKHQLQEAILEYEKAINNYKKINDDKTIARIKLNLGYLYANQNNFFKSTLLYEETIPILQKHKDWLGLSAVYGRIGVNFGSLSMNEKAIEYHKKGLSIDRKYNLMENEAYTLANIATEYAELKHYKLSKEYYNLAIDKFRILKSDNNLLINRLQLALIKYKEGNFDDALKDLRKIATHKNNKMPLSYYHLYANLMANSGNFKEAKIHFETSLDILQKDQNKTGEKDLIYDYLHFRLKKNNDKELLHLLEKYDSIERKINSDENKMYFTNWNTKYQTAEKEDQIKSQQLELEKEKTNRNVAISSIGFLLLLSGGGFLFFKNHQQQKELQNQNTLLSLQHSLNAMELQSLNKQLDPHEIKNLLAFISPEIQEKAPESYKNMLKLFNITKASLNSHSLTESIKTQINQIEDFLSLEKSMLSEPLEYSIENKIENEDVQIPRLMLKNLVENAIKHGIKGKENGGKIKVKLLEKDNFIFISIDDSGKGRNQNILSDSGIGTSTYQKLFTTLNQKNKENAIFEITDKEQGTKVEVKIPKDYKYS
ncbi:ATP-binding protein [Chryseobacterium shigense]|uniref:Tetratricopeptide (TPR) repeat protein n=1 Tax=Chryseobacterium shigense TaxID=297244 RepID=A0A841NFJ8_9FLAO|nr:ATP-binding protein [Chryseobacterium shigense]MBB6372618.1 tetratricopeptide (TPR) repeat protein [Chryseobacterium shigense]